MQIHGSEAPILQKKLIKSNVNIHLFSFLKMSYLLGRRQSYTIILV